MISGGINNYGYYKVDDDGETDIFYHWVPPYLRDRVIKPGCKDWLSPQPRGGHNGVQLTPMIDQEFTEKGVFSLGHGKRGPRCGGYNRAMGYPGGGLPCMSAQAYLRMPCPLRRKTVNNHSVGVGDSWPTNLDVIWIRHPACTGFSTCSNHGPQLKSIFSEEGD